VKYCTHQGHACRYFVRVDFPEPLEIRLSPPGLLFFWYCPPTSSFRAPPKLTCLSDFRCRTTARGSVFAQSSPWSTYPPLRELSRSAYPHVLVPRRRPDRRKNISPFESALSPVFTHSGWCFLDCPWRPSLLSSVRALVVFGATDSLFQSLVALSYASELHQEYTPSAVGPLNVVFSSLRRGILDCGRFFRTGCESVNVRRPPSVSLRGPQSRLRLLVAMLQTT